MANELTFKLTDAGTYAASMATPQGPFIQIVAFKLGDNADIPASHLDTGLAGNMVYQGTPASYSYYDSTTIQINLEVPADVGPFDFGEIGLYLPGDILFARFSYGVLRTKQTSISSGFANVLRIKALIRIAQGPAVFNVTTLSPQVVLEVDTLQLVNTPLDNPQSPLVIVHEPTDFQEAVYLYKMDDTMWNIVNYCRIGTAVVTDAPDATHLTASLFSTLYQPTVGSRGKYVIQTVGGYLRALTEIYGNTATLAQPIDTSGLIGETVAVYEIDTVLLNDLMNKVATLQLAISNLDLYLGMAVLSSENYVVNTGSASLPPEIFSVTFNASNPLNATITINLHGPYPLVDALGLPAALGMISPNETRTIIFSNDICVVQDLPYQAFPEGTRMPFNQSVAPPGWTKDTNPYLNDSIMRLITSDVDADGSLGFLSWNGQTTVGGELTFGEGNGHGTGSMQHTHALVHNLKYNDFIIAVRGSTIPAALPPVPDFFVTPVGFVVPPPVASFTAIPNAGSTTTQFTFTNTTASPFGQTTLVWDFGDGTTYVETIGSPPTNNEAYGPAPLTVQFTDTTTRSPASWLWDFGDGTTSTLQNPQHTYTGNGRFTVSLTATNAKGSRTKTYPNMVSTEFIFNDVVSVNTPNYILRSRAIAAGWDTFSPLRATVTVDSGVYLGSVSASNPAFDLGTGITVGSTISLINNGNIIGLGGSANGGAGGPALNAPFQMSITNNGVIGGGGGGGGAGQCAQNIYSGWVMAGGGGGGGRGYNPGSGGPRNGYTSGAENIHGSSAGTAGTLTTAGSRGLGGYGTNSPNGYIAGGPGGPGGNLGAPGTSGENASAAGEDTGTQPVNNIVSATPGGAGGACTTAGSNANITWVVPGIRYGALL